VDDAPDSAAVDGVLLLDKPAGPSSNAVLQRAKKLLGAKRAGHTGTLDPLAGGLLVLTLGEATKFSGELLDADKTYRATLKFGARTSTGDAEGEVLERCEVKAGRSDVLKALEGFRGPIMQTPPMYAAIKHQGRPLYSYARRGEDVARAARPVTVRRIELESFEGQTATLEVECSKGTYVRVLAEDIGEVLGCGAHLAALVRTAVGPFRLGDAIGVDALEALPSGQRRRKLLPPDALLGPRPRVILAPGMVGKFRQGQAVPAGLAGRGHVGVYTDGGAFLGTGEVGADGVLRPKRLVALG
jgi:tRNA pseudouridine55 synthase